MQGFRWWDLEKMKVAWDILIKKTDQKGNSIREIYKTELVIMQLGGINGKG